MSDNERRPAAAGLAVLLVSVVLMAAVAADALATAMADGNDWPMLAHDPARSGGTSVEVRPPFERAWYRLFPEEGLPAGTQAVIAGGKVFIGTLAGVVHAIDAGTGADVWTHRAPGPILHACAAAGEKVFFGCADGGIHALHAADGSPAWRVPTGAAVWNAPLVHEGVVVAGSRDGVLYGIDAGSGEVRWHAAAGAPFLSSPALDARTGRVYAASEDMRVHAYRLADGSEAWMSDPLPGATFRGYHPVVAPDGSVMVTSAPAISLDAIEPVLLDMVKEIFGDFASWRHPKEENERLRGENFAVMEKPETYPAQLAYLRRRLADERALRTFFVLDPETGKERFVAPIVYAESMNGTGAPPVVTPGGKVVVKFQALLRSRYQHYSPFLNVGYLDTATGLITPIMDQTRTYGWHDSLLLVHDEQCQLSVAGRVLLNAHQDNVNAMDLETLDGYREPFCRGIHEPREGEAMAIWARLLRGGELPPGKEWLVRGTAVYGGGSVIDSSVSIAGDSFYYIPTHEMNAGAALIAYRMRKEESAATAPVALGERIDDELWPRVLELPWDWDMLGTSRLRGGLDELPGRPAGTIEAPLADEAQRRAGEVTDAEIDRVIWEAPALGRETGDGGATSGALGERLAGAVRELVSRRWRPLIFPAGKHPGEAYRLFADPLDELETLALAWPHLPEDLRPDVGARARSLARRWGAVEEGQGQRGAAERGAAGERRSRYEEPPARLVRVRDDVRRRGVERLYPLWLWGHASGDWEAADAGWEEVRRVAEAAPDAAGARPTGSRAAPLDCGNARLAGLIAYCRLARRRGDAAALERGLALARAAARERIVYELAHPRGGLIGQAPVLRTIFSRWRHLSPEVGRLLVTHARATHERLMAVSIDHHRPTWWLAWNVETLWRNECPFEFPTASMEIFSARAFVLGEPAETLERFLDIPWCGGDVFFARKLALCLRARAGVRWIDLRAPPR